MPHPRSVPGAGELLRRTGRWLEAAPEAVVELRDGPPEGRRERSENLTDGLAAWADALARARRVALLRRALLVALAVVAPLLLARAVLGAPPLGVAVGLGLAAVAATLFPLARRRPAPAAVARLLDRRLGLHDTVATAWELEERAVRPPPAARADRRASRAESADPLAARVVARADRRASRAESADPLAARVVADGERLVREARATTRARPAPARGEWSLLAGGVAAVAALALIGAPGGSSSTARVRADAGAAAAAPSAARTTPATPSGTPTTATAPAPATTPAGTPRAPGALSRGAAGGDAANGRDAASGGIAIRRTPARADGGARGSGAGSGSGSGGRGADGRAGTGAGSAAGRRSQSSVAPQPAASLPAPSQVKEFAAEGRRATAPLAAGAPSQTGRADAPGAPGAARSGTRGAGSQAGRGGGATAARPTTAAGAERLPLRLLTTGGGDRRAAGAGRAGTGGSGRGAARVQGGVTGPVAGGPLELPFVPPAVNAVAPYLRALVAAYFPPQ